MFHQPTIRPPASRKRGSPDLLDELVVRRALVGPDPDPPLAIDASGSRRAGSEGGPRRR